MSEVLVELEKLVLHGIDIRLPERQRRSLSNIEHNHQGVMEGHTM